LAGLLLDAGSELRTVADTFQLEIVTPAKLMVKDVAEEAQIPGLSGYLGILPGHAPLITELAVGVITYKTR
jgi:F-type H+-transporting ATPase subunit epsilon